MSDDEGKRLDRLWAAVATGEIKTCSASAMWRLLHGLHEFLEIVCTCWTVFDGTKPWVWADHFDKDKGDFQIMSDNWGEARPLDVDCEQLDQAYFDLCVRLGSLCCCPDDPVSPELRKALDQALQLSELDELGRLLLWRTQWCPQLAAATNRVMELVERPGAPPADELEQGITKCVGEAVQLAEGLRDKCGRACPDWLKQFGDARTVSGEPWSGRPSELPLLQQRLLENLAVALEEFGEHFSRQKPRGTRDFVIRDEEDRELLLRLREAARQFLAWLIDAGRASLEDAEVRTEGLDAEQARMVRELYRCFAPELPKGYVLRQHVELFSTEQSGTWSEVCHTWRSTLAQGGRKPAGITAQVAGSTEGTDGGPEDTLRLQQTGGPVDEEQRQQSTPGSSAGSRCIYLTEKGARYGGRRVELTRSERRLIEQLGQRGQDSQFSDPDLWSMLEHPRRGKVPSTKQTNALKRRISRLNDKFGCPVLRRKSRGWDRLVPVRITSSSPKERRDYGRSIDQLPRAKCQSCNDDFQPYSCRDCGGAVISDRCGDCHAELTHKRTPGGPDSHCSVP